MRRKSRQCQQDQSIGAVNKNYIELNMKRCPARYSHLHVQRNSFPKSPSTRTYYLGNSFYCVRYISSVTMIQCFVLLKRGFSID
ncbi:hypothetical protein FKM82_001100 [Ascaphus truei]